MESKELQEKIRVLKKKWDSTLNSIGFDDDEYEDSAVEFSEHAFHCDDKSWGNLKTIVSEQDAFSLQPIPEWEQKIVLESQENDYITLTLSRERFSQNETVDIDQLDGMTREEALDYLSDIEDVEEFDYIKLSASFKLNVENESIRVRGCYGLWTRILSNEDFSNGFEQIILRPSETLKTSCRLYKEILTEITQEAHLQKKAEEKRKQARAANIAKLEVDVKRPLREAGWDGQYCVRPYSNFSYDKFGLCVRINEREECRVYDTSDFLLQSIPKLVTFAKEYKTLSSKLEALLQASKSDEISAGHEDVVRRSKWLEV